MGKYEPLGQFLRKQKADRIPMTFAEIERIIGAKLPPSKKSRAFWSNNSDNNVMTRQWTAAGYESETIDIKGQRLVFRRKAHMSKSRKKMKLSGEMHPIFGCLVGLATLAEDYDPTEPTGEDWEVGYLADDRR